VEPRPFPVAGDSERNAGADRILAAFRFFDVRTFRDGRVVRLSIHTDKNRALEAAGLSG
jgi:hypothetical protein